MITPNSINVNN